MEKYCLKTSKINNKVEEKMIISEERTKELLELKKKKKERTLNKYKPNSNFNQEYKGLVCGFNVEACTTLKEIDKIYNQAMCFRSKKARIHVVKALKSRIIKLKLITDRKVLNSYLRVDND